MLDKKAKAILAKIEKWTEKNTPLKNNINIDYLDTLPKISFPEYDLNKDWGDDVLLATILQYKKDKPSNDVCLISEDTVVRLKARSLGIDFFRLPGELKLPVELDRVEKENQELKKKIAKLESALPKLAICFSESKEPFQTFSLSAPPAPVGEKIKNKIEELKKKYPKQHPENCNIGNLHNVLLGPSSEEYDRYNEELVHFFKQYENYLQSVWKMAEVESRSIKFQIEIKNTGGAPADDIDICFCFPDGFEMLTENDYKAKILQPPLLPKEPRTVTEMLGKGSKGLMPSKHIVIPDPPKPSSFSLKKTNSYELHDHVQRIKHGSSFQLKKLVLTFDPVKSAKSFSCKYTIRPANLPEPLVGKLNFAIKK